MSLVLLYVAIGTTIARAAQKHGGGQFDQTAPPIRLINQTIFQAFAELYQSTGIVISVERILGRNGPLVDERFTATIRGGKPFQVLNDICALDRRYCSAPAVRARNHTTFEPPSSQLLRLDFLRMAARREP